MDADTRLRIQKLAIAAKNAARSSNEFADGFFSKITQDLNDISLTLSKEEREEALEILFEVLLRKDA